MREHSSSPRLRVRERRFGPATVLGTQPPEHGHRRHDGDATTAIADVGKLADCRQQANGQDDTTRRRIVEPVRSRATRPAIRHGSHVASGATPTARLGDNVDLRRPVADNSAPIDQIGGVVSGRTDLDHDQAGAATRSAVQTRPQQNVGQDAETTSADADGHRQRGVRRRPLRPGRFDHADPDGDNNFASATTGGNSTLRAQRSSRRRTATRTARTSLRSATTAAARSRTRTGSRTTLTSTTSTVPRRTSSRSPRPGPAS